MNEHGFTKAILRILPASVHVQSMTMAALTTNGTPDRYLDYKRDLWVEFKYADTSGARKGLNVGEGDKSMLSAQQKLWLRRRFDAGGNALVVVGVPSDRTRGFVLTEADHWESRVSPEFIMRNIRNAPEIAAYILSRVS